MQHEGECRFLWFVVHGDPHLSQVTVKYRYNIDELKEVIMEIGFERVPVTQMIPGRCDHPTTGQHLKADPLIDTSDS